MLRALFWPVFGFLWFWKWLLIICAPIVLLMSLAGAGATGRANGIATAIVMAALAYGLSLLTRRGYRHGYRR